MEEILKECNECLKLLGYKGEDYEFKHIGLFYSCESMDSMDKINRHVHDESIRTGKGLREVTSIILDYFKRMKLDLIKEKIK